MTKKRILQSDFWRRFVESSLAYYDRCPSKWMLLEGCWECPWKNPNVWNLFLYGKNVPPPYEYHGLLELSSLTIEKPSGRTFEWLMRDLFEFLGFECLLTSRSHDAGVDLIVKTPAGSVEVQLKHMGHSVGRKPILDVFAGKHFYRTDHAAVISLGGFSLEAMVAASKLDVKLFQKYELLNLIDEPAIFVATFLSQYRQIQGGSQIEFFSALPTHVDQEKIVFSLTELWPIRSDDAFLEAWTEWLGQCRPSTGRASPPPKCHLLMTC